MDEQRGHCLDTEGIDEGRDHIFESKSGSGIFMYTIDEDEPLCVKFKHMLKLRVLFDLFDNKAEIQVDSEVQDGDTLSVPAQSQMLNSVLEDEASSLSQDLESECMNKESDAEVNVESSDCRYKTRSLASRKDLKETKAKRQRLEQRKPRSITRRKKVKGNVAAQLAGKDCHSDKRADDGVDVKNHVGFAHVNDEYNTGPHSKLNEEDYGQKLRSSSRAVKANVRPVRKSKSSKPGKTSSQLTCKKISKSSDKSLQQTQAGPILKSENGDDINLRTKEKTKKLLVDKNIKCEYCEVNFKNQQEFYDHRRAEESVHRCGICGKVEPYEAHLIVHMQRHRRVKVEAGSGSPDKSKPDGQLAAESKVSYKRKNKKEKMKCNICGLVVSSMDSLKIHTLLHTGEHAYRCCVCGESFSSLSSRQHHMDTHVSAQRFKCNPCGERFTSRAELAKHQLTHEIKCALCGEVFPNKTSRTCHFRVAHPNDILKCSVCSNMFATVEDLNKHLVYHKKGKKEQCPECGVVVSKLKDHMLMHSQVAHEKLYVCDQCPMRYLRKSNLDRHMRTHTGEKPYACNRCPKSFRSNGMLRKHLLTHTQERPYQCEVCGKRCSLRSNLNIHMRVHNSDRHFSCELCSQTFNHKNSLHGHMKSKHARGMNVQMGGVIMATNPALPPQPQAADLTEMDKSLSFDDRHLQNLGLQDVAVPGSHHNYAHMHQQMVFSSELPENVAVGLFMDADRNTMGKYEVHSQASHAHGY